MAGTDRNIRKSVMARLRALFKAPPAASGFAPFGVYSEDDLIAVNRGASLPNRPFVFLLDSYVRPKPPALPLVVVDVTVIHQTPYELGNRSGRWTDVTVHNFGRQRGERDDCASLVADYFGSTFSIYQYTSGSSGDTAVFLENAELMPDIVLEEQRRALSPDERREGTLDLWMTVSFRFHTKT